MNRPVHYFLALFSLALLLAAVLTACSNRGPRLETASPAPLEIETLVATALTAAAPQGAGTLEPPVSNVPPAEAPATQVSQPPQSQEPLPPALRVVYVKDKVIWLWTEGGPPLQLTASSATAPQSIRLSDDGRLVAFVRPVDDLHSEIWAVNTDATQERVLVDAAALTDMDPGALAVVPNRLEWVPGTHTLAFNTRQVFEGPGVSLYNDLRLVDVDQDRASTLLAPGQAGEFFFSPDGQYIALSTPNAISLARADGSLVAQNVITYDLILTYSEYQYYPQAVWSPDSSFFRVVLPPTDALSEPRPPSSLWRVGVNGSATQEASLVAAPFFASPITYSPDASRVTYIAESGSPAENRGELHLANADGSQDTIYHSAALLQFAAWAGDNQHFFFTQGDERQTLLGQVGETGAAALPYSPNPFGIVQIQALDTSRVLYVQATGAAGAEVFELRLGQLNGESLLIDSMSGNLPAFDFDL